MQLWSWDEWPVCTSEQQQQPEAFETLRQNRWCMWLHGCTVEHAVSQNTYM